MLSRGSSHPDTALDDTVNLTVPFMYAVFLIVILHIAVSRLIRQCTDGSRAEGLAFSEDNLRIVMSLTLVLAGEVQVDIRLLVSLESQECLKGDVEAILCERMAADRTLLILHITSGHTGILLHFLRIKIVIMAVGTVIMRTQGVNLRDTGHVRDKGRSYRTTGTYEIPVLVGLPHQFLRNDVHNGETVGNDGVQLPLQTLRNDRRQVVTVDHVSPVVTDLPQIPV